GHVSGSARSSFPSHSAATSASSFRCSRYPDHSHLHSFPTRRSSDLPFRSPILQSRVLQKSGGTHLASNFRGSTFDKIKIALQMRSEEHTSELQSRVDLVCRLLLEKKKES